MYRASEDSGRACNYFFWADQAYGSERAVTCRIHISTWMIQVVIFLIQMKYIRYFRLNNLYRFLFQYSFNCIIDIGVFVAFEKANFS
jgi:hypothetical protein